MIIETKPAVRFATRLLLFALCSTPILLPAQEIFLSTLDHRLFQLDLNDCTYQQVGNVPAGSTDICFHPNTYLYSISTTGRLFQVNIATGAGTLVHAFESNSSQLYTSLTADANGVFYACGLGGKLWSYNLATNTGTYLGNVGYAAEGDLTFYNGQLYMAASGDDIVRVDINNPANSSIAVDGNVPGRIFGIVSHAATCDSVASYAFTDNAANIYRVDYENATLVPFCSIPLAVSGGASMFEYLGSNPINIDELNINGFDCNASSGSISVEASGGIGTLSYALNTQNYQTNPSFSNLPVNNYTLFVQDEVGCIVSEVVELGFSFPAIESIGITPATCNESNGSFSLVVAGGTPPYTLSVNSGPASNNLQLQNLAAGVYQLNITDATGCGISTTITVPSANAPNITSLSITPTSCGEDNGRISVNVQGGLAPISYALNGNTQTTGQFNDLPAGNYTLTITDANACVLTQSAIITDSEALLLDSLNIVHATCGEANGQITILASGGQTPLAYSVDGTNFLPINTFSNLAADDYLPTVMDALGCVADAQSRINGTVPPRFMDYTVQAAECEEANGSLNATFAGGSGFLTLQINGRAQPLDFPITALEAGTYVLELRDSLGCRDTLSLVLPRSNCPIYLPNAFSPNADGINDRFAPQAIGDLDAWVNRFYIFDRWGGLVFKSENRAFADPANAWDGRKAAQPLTQGIFTWLLEVTFSDGKREVLSGDVLLLR